MKRVGGIAVALVALFATACEDPMIDQPRYEPLEASSFHADGRSARLPVPGTVPRGHLDEDVHFATGLVGGKPADEMPMAVTRELLERGRERFDIFCAPCHDRAGHGRGMIVQRGFQSPTSFHDEDLRAKPVGHYVDVMTRGFGAMASYAKQVPPSDRWAIAAWIRTLQLSQHAAIGDVPPDRVERLQEEDR